MPLRGTLSKYEICYILEHGGNENDKDRERWDLRQRADIAEKIMKDNYKNIDKDYNPWSGNEMDF